MVETHDNVYSIEFVFFRIIKTFLKHFSIIKIISCLLFLLMGICFAWITGYITRKLLEFLFSEDGDSYKKNSYYYNEDGYALNIPKSRSGNIMSHSRILFIERFLNILCVFPFIYSCILIFVNSIGHTNISIFGFILVTIQTTRSSLGAGLWILLSKTIERGDIIKFMGDGRILRVKEIDFMTTRCIDVTHIMIYIETRKHSYKQLPTFDERSIPNNKFLSHDICFVRYFKKKHMYRSRTNSNNRSNILKSYNV